MTKKTDAAPESGYIRRIDAERLLAENAARVAEIERDQQCAIATLRALKHAERSIAGRR